MEAPEDKSVFEKIVAAVTPEEIEFMKMFEIDDGDGTIDGKGSGSSGSSGGSNISDVVEEMVIGSLTPLVE